MCYILKNNSVLHKFMRTQYLVYPEAQEKLKGLFLQERLKKAEEDGNMPHLGGFIAKENIKESIEEMQELGFFKTLPKKEKKIFMGGLHTVLENSKKSFWKIHRNGKVLEEKVEYEDLLLMSGWMSSFLLEPSEIWSYKNAGFEYLTDFTGSIGAMIWQLHNKNSKKGYTWNSSSPDGRHWINMVTGDMNFDLRIFRTDITPDKTLDPLGNPVLYRPEIYDDRKVVAPIDSTEPRLLVSLLKYVRQTGIAPEVLRDKGKALIEETKAEAQRRELYVHHLPGIKKPESYIVNFNSPIPVLDKEYRTEVNTVDWMASSSGAGYEIYIGPEQEFIFSSKPTQDFNNPIKPVYVSFQPSDINDLIKGLFYQCASCLGRTPAAQVIGILEYRFSPQFESDLAGIKRLNK